MNQIVNAFLLAGDKFMPEMHLKQPGFTYSPCGPFTKHKQRIQKFMQTGDTNYIYRDELDKACFHHDAAYSDSKNLAKKTKSDKVLKNRALEIANNPKYDGYQGRLANELHKPIIRKFRKRKVYFYFKDNTWGGGGDLADMQLISKYNKGI